MDKDETGARRVTGGGAAGGGAAGGSVTDRRAVSSYELMDDAVAVAWREHRPHLVDLAFRMLGDIAEAEDVVQEAFARLVRHGVGSVDDEKGWLIVVTSRLCLDQVRSARHRRQCPQGEGLGGSADEVMVGGGVQAVDPADRVTLDDNVRLALLVVLERLTPAERVAFVLHDVFAMPFESVASTLGKTPASCRQLARRARLKISSDSAGASDSSGGGSVGTARSGGTARFTVDASRHREVTDRFIAACANGDLSALLAVLDPDVSGTVDLAVHLVVRGAENVGANIIRFWGQGAVLVSQPVGGGASVALLGFIERRLAGVLLLDVVDGRVVKIHAIAQPSSLAALAGGSLAGR